MKQINTVLAKNALANLLRGVATAMVALALPHFLTKSLGPRAVRGLVTPVTDVGVHELSGLSGVF